MATADDRELVEQFERLFRDYYDDDIKDLARAYPTERRSLYLDWDDLYMFDPDLAEDYRSQPGQLREYAEEALRLYDLPVDVKLGQAHVRIRNLPDTTDIREIRSRHVNTLVSVSGIVRKATDVQPKIEQAAFECQRCGTLTHIPQSSGTFQEPHECQGCERQGPFQLNFDQSEFVDAQKLRVQESPEGLRGGETPQALDVHIEDDITGEVTPGDHVSVTGALRLEQQGNQQEKSPLFDVYMEGISVEVDEEQFEDMEITDADKQEIVELSTEPDIYEQMVGSIAPSIYGYDQEKLAMILQLFSGVTKELPDESRIRGDLHMLLIGDPGTGKSQLLSYIQNIAPRSVYTSGKGSSSAGLTAAAVRDDFGEGQQWTLEAGALVLADQGIAAVDELDKMRCVTGDSLVHLGDGRVDRIRDVALEASKEGAIEDLPNGRTIRDVDLDVWTMTDDGSVVTRPVTAIHEYEAPETLTEVKLATGESLTSTADHPFFVLEDGQRREKAAEELDSGDWVYVPRQIPSAVADGGAVSSPPTTQPSGGRSEAMAAVLGYLAGDGNLYYDQQEGVYGIRFTNKEEELLDHFETVCRRAFDAKPIRPPSEQRNDGVETVRVTGRDVADAVIDAGMNLETYDRKRLPRAVTTASRAAKAAFLRALADSEGCVEARNVKIHSSSYELLLGAKHLLLEFGISCQIQHDECEGKRDVYTLAITDAESLRTFEGHVGFTLDRKRRALDAVCETVDGDRTILDVVPECGELLEDLRSRLRLYQSECGIGDATYCDFENGNANVSIHRARRILDAFETRIERARKDRTSLDESDLTWTDLSVLRERYHVSQSELAAETQYSQQQVSRLWGDDEELREIAVDRLLDVVSDVARVDLAQFRTLVEGDVKWRRVSAVRTVSGADSDDQRAMLREELADLVACPSSKAVERARTLLEGPRPVDDWGALQREIDRYGVSHTELASDLGVHQTTVSRWFAGTVETDRFGEVRDAALERIDEKRSHVGAILEEFDARGESRVYDLTVEGTHNFVANGMIVHNSEDRSAMHQALEQQEISISKAGINATLKSRCSLLGAANPKYGRFDQYEPIGEQIDLEPALISRFDLIFTVTDEPDAEEDRNLAEHILKTNYAGELNTQHARMTSPDVSREEVDDAVEDVDPVIDAELLRKYVAHAKQNCHPRMTDEAREAIRDFYVDLRAEGLEEDAPVPVTARQLEALVRLAEASARVRLSDTVSEDDADRVIEIVRSCLRDIGVDPETGQFDADVVETGTSKSQRDRIHNLKELIGDVEEEYEEGAPVDVVMERVDEIGMDTSKAEHEIEKLKNSGELYQPSNDHLRTT